jgi:hypothetical protein
MIGGVHRVTARRRRPEARGHAARPASHPEGRDSWRIEARSARTVAVPGAYSFLTVFACVSTTLRPAPGAMPLVRSHGVPSTGTTSSGF